MPEFIKTNVQDRIFEISLSREDKRNALHTPMMQEIDAALDDAERAYLDGSARVMIIRAEGRVFSSGIDLVSFMGDENRFGENWRDNLFPTTFELQSTLNKIENHSMPVICLLHGYCIGLGFEMALACDFRIAAERTRISLPEARLGIIPDVGGTTRLTRLVGSSRAKEIIMTGRTLDLNRAETWGLLNYVVPSDELLDKARSLAEELMLSAPMAVTYAKRVINEIATDLNDLRTEALAQAHLIRTEDFENGVRGMLSRESVEWKGR